MNTLLNYFSRALAIEPTTHGQRAYQEALRVYSRAYRALHDGYGNEDMRPAFEVALREYQAAWYAMSADEQAPFKAVA